LSRSLRAEVPYVCPEPRAPGLPQGPLVTHHGFGLSQSLPAVRLGCAPRPQGPPRPIFNPFRSTHILPASPRVWLVPVVAAIVNHKLHSPAGLQASTRCEVKKNELSDPKAHRLLLCNATGGVARLAALERHLWTSAIARPTCLRQPGCKSKHRHETAAASSSSDRTERLQSAAFL